MREIDKHEKGGFVKNKPRKGGRPPIKGRGNEKNKKGGRK
jgi:hypothetical protein